MTLARGRAWSTVLAAWCLVAACSLTSDLDELEGNPASSDASSNQCTSGVDCSGCAGCDAWCTCLSSGNLAACVAQCSDGGGATGGGSGYSGSGGSGAADASAGGAAGTGGLVTAGAGGTSGGAAGAAGSAGSAGVSFEPGVVHCVGTNDCVLSTSHCCIGQLGADVACEPLSTTCSGLSANIRCDGPEDCGAGDICCGDVTFGEFVTLAECRKTCTSPDLVVCGGTPNVCPTGQSCVQYEVSGMATKYNICN